MSLPPEHKKPQSAWLDLGVFAGVLAFLGYSIYAFMEIHRPLPQTEVPPPIVEGPPPESPVRKLASQVAKGAGSTDVLRIPCLQFTATPVFDSQARLLQIHAPLCAGDAKVATWHASNESSGEEILVFVNRKEKFLSTNYFNLKDGTNRIVFVQDRGAGQSRVEKLQIIRKPDQP